MASSLARRGGRDSGPRRCPPRPAGGVPGWHSSSLVNMHSSRPPDARGRTLTGEPDGRAGRGRCARPGDGAVPAVPFVPGPGGRAAPSFPGERDSRPPPGDGGASFWHPSRGRSRAVEVARHGPPVQEAVRGGVVVVFAAAQLRACSERVQSAAPVNLAVVDFFLLVSSRRFRESSRRPSKLVFLRPLAASRRASYGRECIHWQRLVELDESFPGSYFSDDSDELPTIDLFEFGAPMTEGRFLTEAAGKFPLLLALQAFPGRLETRSVTSRPRAFDRATSQADRAT
ncbi:hypothetical protein THAOC_26804 [Thalassiosira oceanica]|uniref:Uncharacterized protein n=1 Tax=Thalassiosira oceanica TaxID=159749 RepID=K0S4C0_THAOC|nr:hypothetical protein THAOC_26804 [Thalassiosira oceanica]|eukprot:EJK53702.1 hypothetical protein THAOC_26804 [Thalassiosira oceanica]